MKKNILLTLMLFVALLTTQVAVAQAPVDSPEEAIAGLLTRIGGSQAPGMFEIVIDAELAENGKDVFIITEQNGKPCIKGNNQLSVATGINWYLNHYAHINLTWNNLTTDLSGMILPVPTSEEKHVCNADYRYDFNTCTFSYSMAFWTWDRWQNEIDWMALHGINAPLNLVGLDVLWRNILKDARIGYTDAEIAAYVPGPGFIAWFAMNNLEGWGGTINSPSTGVSMNGNPDWWYTRQEQLCRDMLQRMRELGMQPVIPGFSGQVPSTMTNKTIQGITSSDIIDNGTWEGYTRPDIINPATASYDYMAEIYYEHLEELMGVSEFYSIDPFHEGSSLPSPATNEGTYPGIMESLDAYYDAVNEDVKTEYKAPEKAKWIIQKWQSLPQQGAFTAMYNRGYGDRFIGLDLFADAPGKAEWDNDFFSGCDFIFCMLHNFGGRTGLHGRLEVVMTNYFEALKKTDCMGIGATPEGSETNPILYDMLFELPWMDSKPNADEWLAKYAYSRYGINPEEQDNANALEALKNLKKSVWNCPTDQQGTTEAVILARPAWVVNNVSTWAVATTYWDTQDVRLAADQFISIKDLDLSDDGEDNYSYDLIDVVRQAMVDYAAELLPLIKAAHDANNTVEYTRLYGIYLQLMLDLDEMLSYDENFNLERWTSLARNIADEATGTTTNDRNWLEWNARTQITVWSNQDNGLHDYSNRCWAGLIEDFHYWRWKYFFENNGNAPNGGWRNGFEYPWTVDFNETYDYAGDYSQVNTPEGSAIEKAAETFGKYFGRVKGTTKNYLFPMGVATDGTKSDVIPMVYRGQAVELPLVIGNETTLTSVWIDLNNDGAVGNGETLTPNGMEVTIPDDATIGKTKAKATFADGTDITFNIALIEEVTEARTVTAVAGENGSVAIEGTNELSINTTEAVKITATANTGYNFRDWTDAQGNVVSNDNPFIYYAKEEATFTANFIEDKWGVVACDGTLSADINGTAQFIHNLTFAYYNREAEPILETTTAPSQIFNTIPQIINAPRGASFNVYYEDGAGDGLKYCYFRAYIDLNADGDFDDEGELLKEVGTAGGQNTDVCSNTINVLLPYDTPLGITHMRLRFDGAWDESNNPTKNGAKDPSIRPVYEIILNITEGSDKAAHIEVMSNNDEWGTVEVWTDETPDGSTGTEWDVSRGIPMYIRATPTSNDAEFLGWYDHYGRLFTSELEYSCLAIEDAVYTARFRKYLEIDGWGIEYRTQNDNEIILTNVRYSGKGDLTIPATLEVLGEQYTIVGFDNDLFNNNKELTSITLPSTIEYLGENVVFSRAITGNGQTQTFAVDIKNNEVWSIKMEVERTAELTGWGACLLASGANPAKGDYETYAEGFQFYLQCTENGADRDKLIVKTKDKTNDGWYFDDVYKETKFTVYIDYNGSQQLSIKVLKADGTPATSYMDGTAGTELVFTGCTIQDITMLCTNVQAAVEITKLKITEGDIYNPFSGCSNLDAIAIDGDCENYYVKPEDGGLYTSSDELVCLPEGKEKGADRRVLGALIEKMQALTAQVGTYSISSENKTELPLSTTEGEQYYIYSNAEIREGNMGYLIDGNDGTTDANNYIHTTWEKNSADGLHHYLRVYLGENPSLSNFCFSYVTRNNGNTEKPKQITVAGSATVDGEYTEIAVLTGLPSAASATYNSPVYSVNGYKYLRFMVDDTYRDLAHSGHKAYSMAEFDLFKVAATADVFKIFEGTELTNEYAAERYDVLLAAIDVYDHGTTALQMQEATEALQTAYDELEAKMKALLPFTLTTDEENPVLYDIYIGRVDNNSRPNPRLQYDEESKMVKVADDVANNSYQAWYFMNSVNGFTIHPYNGDGKVLSGDAPSSGAGKISAVTKGDKDVYEWLLVKQGDEGDYSIQVANNTRYYLSNWGGAANNMGYWDGDVANDGGSKFRFIDATFENDNPRYYQLKDVKATMPDGTSIYEGTSVGLYVGGADYRTAYTAAAELETAGNTSDATECHDAYKALRAAKEGLSYNAPATDKLYFIVSTATNNYCAGKYLRTGEKPFNSTAGWGTGSYNHTNLSYNQYIDIAPKSLAAFQFEETGAQGGYKMKNLHTGLYVKAFAGTHMGAENEAATVKITGIADGQVALKIGNEDPMHAQEYNAAIVKWGAEKNNASTWTIDEVTNLSQFNYTVTVPESGIATLNLAYNVVLPAGVTAYDVAASSITQKNGEYVYTLSEVATAGEVLAKGTPVIIKAAAGSYEFAITLSDDGAKGAVDGSVLGGTYWQADITSAESAHYYTLGIDGEGNPVFNYVTATTTIDANTCWMLLGEKQGDVIYDAANVEDFILSEGVYNIIFNGEPIFVGYTEPIVNSAYEAAGYHLFNATDANSSAYVAASVPADALFTITQSGAGYKLSAQGMYLENTKVGDWAPLFFSADEAEAAVYLLEETGDDGIFKLKSSEEFYQYVKSWDLVFGNDVAATATSTFSFTPVTEYTLTVGEEGITTLCLPFNVELPEGVTAYEILSDGVALDGGRYEYTLTEFAVAGDVIAKGTPFIAKAAAGNHTLTITMSDEDAKSASQTSVLRGTFVKKTIATEAVNYKLTIVDGSAMFTYVTADTEVAANTCWMELDEKKGDYIYDESYEQPIVPVTELTAGGVYRIKSVVNNATDENKKNHYLAVNRTSFIFSTSTKEDKSDLWVCLAGEEEGKYKFVNALGTAAFGWQSVTEEPQEFTVVAGAADATLALYNGSEYLAVNVSDAAAFATSPVVTQGENLSTDWSFELVEGAGVAFETKIKKNYKWATLYLPYAVNIPDDVVAYYATETDIVTDNETNKKVIKLTEILNVIPKKTAVLLYRVDDTPSALLNLSFTLADDVDALAADNLFKGNILPTPISAETDKVYMLYNINSKEAFYWIKADANNNVSCEANKAYFTQPSSKGASSYSFRFDWGGTTDIDEIIGEAAGDDAVIYDLQGRRVLETVKGGIYIKNGEKFIAQ